MRGYKTKEDKLREVSVEQKNVPKRTDKYTTKEFKAFILVILLLAIIIKLLKNIQIMNMQILIL